MTTRPVAASAEPEASMCARSAQAALRWLWGRGNHLRDAVGSSALNTKKKALKKGLLGMLSHLVRCLIYSKRVGLCNLGVVIMLL